MCSDAHQHGDWSEVLANMREPMPLGRKLFLVARNTWIKIRTRSTCCGNHGEPGC